jgi:hypothetical protein
MNERKVDLSTFRKIKDDLALPKNGRQNSYFSYEIAGLRDYSNEEIARIIKSSSIDSLRELSYTYYRKNGFYKQIINYYATLLNYCGLLIPNPSFGKQLSKSHNKKYNAALEFLEKLNLPEVLTRITLQVLINGSYYGIIESLNKDDLIIIDLPVGRARSRFRDIHGNDIVEFDVTYFNSILDEEVRREALSVYPKEISSYYYSYKKGKKSTPWVALSAEMGICFSLLDERPMFIDIIPSTIQYDDAVDTEREREMEEIRKIIVQKIPHLTDGQLLFEPDEAVEMHQGAVHMMRGNKNLSILTTYADVDAIISKTAADNNSTSLEKMLQNVYANAGVSGQLFAPTNTQALAFALKTDLALMMVLGDKYSRFLTYIINTLFSTTNLTFKYSILPVTEYNKSDFITDTFKLAQSGYSFLLPAVAAGLNQLELVNIKNLENDILKLDEVLKPLSSSYTQSGKPSTGKVGRPEKPLEEKAVKTIQNEDALNKGGSD